MAQILSKSTRCLQLYYICVIIVDMIRHKLYADGSTLRNPGPGAWASLLMSDNGSGSIVYVGKAEETTSGRMELEAILRPLQKLVRPACVIVYSDAQHVVNIINEKLTPQTIATLKNQDLWTELYQLTARDGFSVTARWVKGHADTEEHNFCDYLARFIARNPDKFHELPLPPTQRIIYI